MQSILGQVAELSKYKRLWECFRLFFPLLNFFFSLPFQRQNENLALPSAEQQALENVKAGLDTWEYTARNTLMYYPTGEVLVPNSAFSISVHD